MREFCHDIKPFFQPNPRKNPDGDCFACALTAALQFLFPDEPPDFEKVWNYFVCENGVLSNTWPGMRKAIYASFSDGYRMDVLADIVRPTFGDIETFSYPWWHFIPGKEYTDRLEGYIRSGFVALTEIDMQGRGPMRDDTHYNSINHFVLLDGVRSDWEPWGDGKGARLTHYVHVVCSVKGSYWIELSEFLRKYGGSGWWLIRREIR